MSIFYRLRRFSLVLLLCAPFLTFARDGGWVSSGGDGIVCFDAILVVYLGEAARIWNKGVGHQSMDRDGPAFVFMGQRNSDIPLIANVRGLFLPESSVMGLNRSVFPHSVFATKTIN